MKSKAKKPEQEVKLEAVTILADWRSHKDTERYFNVEWKGFSETAWVAESEISDLALYHEYVQKYLRSPYKTPTKKVVNEEITFKSIPLPTAESDSEDESEVIFEELTDEKRKRLRPQSSRARRAAKRQRI